MIGVRFRILLGSPVDPRTLGWEMDEILASLPEGADREGVMTAVARAALGFSAKLWPADRTRREVEVVRDHLKVGVVRDWRLGFGSKHDAPPVTTTLFLPDADADIARISVDETSGEGEAWFLDLGWLEWFLLNDDKIVGDVRDRFARAGSRLFRAVEDYGRRKDKERRKRK